jgi:hypothetical protein
VDEGWQLALFVCSPTVATLNSAALPGRFPCAQDPAAVTGGRAAGWTSSAGSRSPPGPGCRHWLLWGHGFAKADVAEPDRPPSCPTMDSVRSAKGWPVAIQPFVGTADTLRCCVCIKPDVAAPCRMEKNAPATCTMCLSEHFVMGDCRWMLNAT